MLVSFYQLVQVSIHTHEVSLEAPVLFFPCSLFVEETKLCVLRISHILNLLNSSPWCHKHGPLSPTLLASWFLKLEVWSNSDSALGQEYFIGSIFGLLLGICICRGMTSSYMWIIQLWGFGTVNPHTVHGSTVVISLHSTRWGWHKVNRVEVWSKK